MRASLVLCALVACAVFVAPPAALASAPVVYQANDASPDTAGAPDISSVSVADNPQGLITFQISFVPGSEQVSQDSFGIYIDADQNPTTGDLSGSGAEDLLLYDGTTDSLGLFRWDGKSSYAPATSQSLTGSFSGDTQSFAIAAADLKITDGFNFNVAAAVGSDPGSSSQVDFVPENDTDLHYSVQSKFVVTLSVSDYGYDTPRAGKPFRTALQVKRSDTQALVSGGASVSCRLTVGGKRVAASGHYFSKLSIGSSKAKSTAVCAWRIPGGTAGKALVANETVSVGGSQTSRTFRLRVRK